MESVQDTVNRIRQLEMKGARNVAIAALEALKLLSEKTSAKSRQEFLKELTKGKNLLFSSRPTEPLMRNAVNWVLNSVSSSQKKQVLDLVKSVSSSAHEFLSNLEQSREQIAEIGAKRIRENMVILTHCHSSTVTRMLRKAKLDGKNFEVICTETRPVLQGRITAEEMLELGVKTTLIVDSAARSMMNKVDVIFVGADAITSEGNIVNKIGTATIAVLANEARVPLYVVSELLKFDPATLCGQYEELEERDRGEVWEDAPEKLVICNPAFEVVRSSLIHGLICEEGIIPPETITETMKRKYPWIF